jgi:hypothetical protein
MAHQLATKSGLLTCEQKSNWNATKSSLGG